MGEQNITEAAATVPDTTPPKGSLIRAEKHAPEWWIVTDYKFFRHATFASAHAERQRLSDCFPHKSFSVHRVKARLQASTTAARLAALDEKLSSLLAFTDQIARLTLDGEADAEGDIYEQSPDDAIECVQALIKNARALSVEATAEP